jgi:hypothetical protein
LNRLHDAFVEQARRVERHIVRGPLLQDFFGARDLRRLVVERQNFQLTADVS